MFFPAFFGGASFPFLVSQRLNVLDILRKLKSMMRRFRTVFCWSVLMPEDEKPVESDPADEVSKSGGSNSFVTFVVQNLVVQFYSVEFETAKRTKASLWGENPMVAQSQGAFCYRFLIRGIRILQIDNCRHPWTGGSPEVAAPAPWRSRWWQGIWGTEFVGKLRLQSPMPIRKCPGLGCLLHLSYPFCAVAFIVRLYAFIWCIIMRL